MLKKEIVKKNFISKFEDRDVILTKLSEAISYLHNKSLNGRITNENNEKVRIQWFKALAYCCSIYNQVKRDNDIEDLQKQIEVLSSQINGLDKDEK